MARKYDLRMISPEEVEFSDLNPRGESPEEISGDESFERLKESVYEFGVLVPIVVHKQGTANRKKPYRLVDGERRLRAALETRAEKIPAHVAPSKTPTDDLIQAVHIHMLRRQWSQVAQTRAIRRIMRDPRYKSPGMSEADRLEKLQELTGCTDTRLKSLRRAAMYSERVLKEVDNGQIKFSHLVHNEESFVEQLEKHYPALLKELGKGKVREVLVQKARQDVLKTRALMENVVPVVARAKSKTEKTYAGRLLKKFIETEDMSAEQVLKAFEKKFPTAQEDVLRQCETITERSEELHDLIGQLHAGQLASFPKAATTLKKGLAELRTAIVNKLRRIKNVTD